LILRRTILLLLVAIVVLPLTSFKDPDFGQLWAEVESLETSGQQRKALEKVEVIYNKARIESNGPQTVKAIIHKVKFTGMLEEDGQAKAFTWLNGEAKGMSGALRQITLSIEAEVLWGYYNQNQWRINERQQSTEVSSDILTWDLRTITQKTDSLFVASLADAAALRTIPIAQYAEVLDPQPDTRTLRPTMHELLVARALTFYQDHQSELAHFEPYGLFNDAKLLGGADDFLKIPKDTATFSPGHRALWLHHQMMQQLAKTPEPFLVANLDRLVYCHSRSTHEAKDSLYLITLNALIKQHDGTPLWAEVAYRKALFLKAQGDAPGAETDADGKEKLTESLKLCQRIVELYPTSFGGRNAAALIAQLTSPNLNIQVAGTELPGSPLLLYIGFKNLVGIDKANANLALRIGRISYSALREKRRSLYGEKLVDWLRDNATTVHERVQTVPHPADLRDRHTEIGLPAMEHGTYVVFLGSSDKLFTKGQADAHAIFHVSDLALVRQDDDQGTKGVTVVHRDKGTPVSTVTIRLYEQVYDNKARGYDIKLAHTLTTDADGRATLPNRNDGGYRNWIVELEKDGKTTPVEDGLSRSWNRDVPVQQTRVQFFTDRAIYRPCQTIHFKGIMFNDNDGKLLAARSQNTEVTLYDANGQKVSSLKLQTNAFGTFSGTFTAPTGTLNGYITMSNEYGAHQIRLEEYKRPNFEVKLEQPKAQFKLKDNVSLSGNVTSYAGVPLSNTEVKYTVVRGARFPYPWRCWGWHIPSGQERQMTNGTVTTDADGNFTITFNAEPDPTIRSRYRPVFSYEIRVDATDPSGETQSTTQSVSVAYHALDLLSDVAATTDPDALAKARIWAANLSGQRQKATVQVKLERLQAPSTTYRTRHWGVPNVRTMAEVDFRRDFPLESYNEADTDPTLWAARSKVIDTELKLTEEGAALPVTGPLGQGNYRLTLTAKDAFGQDVDLIQHFVLDDAKRPELPGPTDFWFEVNQDSVRPGQKVEVSIGSGFDKMQFRLDVEVMATKGYRSRVIDSRLVNVDKGRTTVQLTATKDWIGNANIRIWSVRHNRFINSARLVVVPDDSKKLNVKLETFRNIMQPDAQEDWKLVVTGANGKTAKTELLASMYDASLDALAPNPWNFYPFRTLTPTYSGRGQGFGLQGGHILERGWRKRNPSFQRREYDRLNWFGWYMGGGGYYDLLEVAVTSSGRGRTRTIEKRTEALSDMTVEETAAATEPMLMAKNSDGDMAGGMKAEQEVAAAPSPEIALRTDLSETVFFRPHVETDAKGAASISFKAPQQLSRWKFQAWALSDSLATGMLMLEVITQKDVMVTVNMPRFFREGDKMWLSARIDAVNGNIAEVKASMQLIDALTGTDILKEQIQTIKLNGKQAEARWEVSIPKGRYAITVRTKAWTDRHSDGVEQTLPVLPDRILVQESMPIAVRRAGRHEVELEKLAQAIGTDAPENVSLTLEFTPNPAWLAVLSLPYMMEYPYDCAEQTFSRFYANSIATHLANSDPAIKAVYAQWKRDDAAAKGALVSPLEKNPDLKRVLLQETPWVRDAQSETEQRRRLGELFDLDLMQRKLDSDLEKLIKKQNPDGGWGWFDGLRSDPYITRHILSGFGHLNRMGVVMGNKKVDAMIDRAIKFHDEEMAKWLKERRRSGERNPLSMSDLHMAYARSFFLDSHLLDGMALQAFNEVEDMARREWIKQSAYGKAMAGLIMLRNGNRQLPPMILRALEDNALRSEEFGMEFKNDRGWYWYQAPIESHVLITEFFHDMKRPDLVNEMNVWLLKQKQTQAWKTTKATADACYALIITGGGSLTTDRKVRIAVGGDEIDQAKLGPEAGTGYIRKGWSGTEVTPSKASVQIMNPTDGVAWGALHWQYMEQLDRITPSTNNIKLDRQLFVKRNTGTTEVLVPWDKAGEVKVGEVVVSRLTVVCDRYLEYVHIKDMRPAAFEPREQLSGPQSKDGLYFYRANSDASVNLFFPHMPKGTFVFEYAMNVAQSGSFSIGITDLQCMYAPEFTVHTGGKGVSTVR